MHGGLPYDELDRAVRAAGFFTNGLENRGDWLRTTVGSKRLSGGRGYSGNSFWVTRLRSGWYLGTWGGHLYHLPDAARLADLCVTWLRRAPDGTRSDFDQPLKVEFGLVPVSDLDFEQAIRAG